MSKKEVTERIKEARNKLILMYGENCFMGYRISSGNPFTYHHIFENRKGGKISIENGALLTYYAHSDLNKLDNCAKDLYNALNRLFKELNKTKKPPTIEYYKEVNGILVKASNIITLSEYCTLNPDYVLLRESIVRKNEKTPVCGSDEILIPSEFKGKIKHGNRFGKKYSYH